MAGDMVSWDDYAGLPNFGGLTGLSMEGGDLVGGISSQAEIDSLQKALMAGADINNPGASAGEGFPLRVESLDKTLFTTTYSAKDIKFWRMLFKDTAYNTIEEFNRLEGYGSGDAAAIAEGELPEEDDSTYSRQYTRIKFLGTTRRVTHVMASIRAAHGDAVARETVNGTLWLLRQIERMLFQGNEDHIGINFDGIEALLVKAWGSTATDDGQYSGYTHTNCIDMRGAPLSEDHITDGCEIVQAEPNFGSATDLWMQTGPLKDLSKILYPRERYDLPGPKDGVAGIDIKAVRTPFGDIALNGNKLMPQSTVPNADGIGKAGKRPGTPTLGSPTSPVYSGTGYFAADDAGAYYYKVVAGSRYGQSPPATSAQVSVSAGDEVTFTVTDAGPDTSYYEVSRSNKDGATSTCRTIFRVARTGSSQSIRDLNRFLPNTTKAYLLTQTPEVLKWKQLTPFTKINLATIDSSVRWMMLLYGALQVQKPLQNLMFINVGRLETGIYA